MTQARLFRIVRLIGALATLAAVGLPVEAVAQTATKSTTAAPRGSSAKKPKLTLKKNKAISSATTPKARRARTARARAAAALREAEEPKFKLDDAGALIPDVRAEAAIIYNPENGQILYESNSQGTRSIASITKIMTAAVFLENGPDLSQEIVVQRADVRAASTTYLRAGYKLPLYDILHLMLIASDNAAARVLSRSSSFGSYEAFIARMNEKARELGLTSTHYSDPSGLLAANVSSAYDMARLIAYVAGDERISSVMRKQYHTIAVGRRTITVHSTNQLVMKGDVDVLGGKTGFISKAGYCLATLLRLPQGGPQVAVVILGARSNAGRFWETRHLFNWLSSQAGDIFATPVQAAGAASTN